MPDPNTQSANSSSTAPNRVRWAFFAAIFMIYWLALKRMPEPLEWQFQSIPPEAPAAETSDQPAFTEIPNQNSPRAIKRFIPNDDLHSVHAGSIVALPDRSLLAFWYGGTREGHRDVSIQTSRFEPESAAWSPNETLVTVAQTQAAENRYIKKLGNPVALLDGEQTLWVFYVSVSVGGWSGASVNFITSTDLGRTWSEPRKVVSSPFFNMCTQVKSRPFLFADGTIGLPVHHEMGLNFSSILRLDRDGNPLAKKRLSAGKTTMQPMPLIIDEENALVLMRYHAEAKPVTAPMTRSSDGGLNWTPLEPSTLVNHDSAITGLALSDGTLLVACNDLTSGRYRLSLLVSKDGGASWLHVYYVEYEPKFESGSMTQMEYQDWFRRLLDEPVREPVDDPDALAQRAANNNDCAAGCAPEFAYPFIIRRGAEFHLLYTWNRAMISEFEFNQAWLEEQIGRATQ
jgi:predicted neuraminidase